MKRANEVVANDFGIMIKKCCGSCHNRGSFAKRTRNKERAQRDTSGELEAPMWVAGEIERAI